MDTRLVSTLQLSSHGRQTMNRKELQCGTFTPLAKPVASVEGNKIMVNGERFIIKGMAYEPKPLGTLILSLGYSPPCLGLCRRPEMACKLHDGSSGYCRPFSTGSDLTTVLRAIATAEKRPTYGLIQFQVCTIRSRNRGSSDAWLSFVIFSVYVYVYRWQLLGQRHDYW